MSLPARLFRCVILLAALARPVPAAKVAGYALLTEPDQGLSALYTLLSSARKSIDLTMYELRDGTVTALLEQAAAQGVAVRVILDQNNEQDRNEAAYADLAAHGVAVHWANPAYACTHQKTITVDGATSAIMTLNFTPQYYPTSRDFAVITTSAADIAAIETTFAADFSDTPIIPPTGANLVWSPTNARSSLLGLIGSATGSLQVENEEMSDRGVVDALCAAAARGVAVRIAMTDRGSYAQAFGQLQDAGAALALYSPSAPLYIHAKVVLADYGTAAAQVFIGSENFSRASLGRNRELGLITTDPGLLASISTTLDADFAGGQPFARG
jgi:phosphatidylserine/phosphatidylglycerophosphate/cardiolipin synthase-like enzyme